MKTYMFPGQGSQFKGMGKDVFGGFEALADEADDILGYSIRRLCLEDPDGQLGKTEYTQPALFVVSALAYLQRARSGVVPDYLIGHSLGEYNALFAAGAFDFGTGLKLVKKRGELMAAAPRGAMAAIVRSTRERVEEVLRRHGLARLCIANFNSPSQFVISGLEADIDAAGDVFQAEAMVFVKLNTGGAFHSPYMQDASVEFAEFIRPFRFSDLRLPVVSNVHARPYLPGEVPSNLVSQITHSVRWNDSIRYLLAQGDMEFVEVGPGAVLTKLAKEIHAQSTPLSASELAELAMAGLAGAAVRVDDGRAADAPPVDRDALQKKVSKQIDDWNRTFPPGTKVRVKAHDDLRETRTRATLLFGHRAAIYLHGYNGYFDLDDVSAAALSHPHPGSAP